MSQPTSEHESQLLERARGKDSAAVGALVEPLRRPLFSYIYRMVTERQDAEDLLQDVLVQVLEGLPGFRLFDARLGIVREVDFTEGSMRSMHDWFFEGLNRREESSANRQSDPTGL
jgi:hypothetical protein